MPGKSVADEIFISVLDLKQVLMGYSSKCDPKLREYKWFVRVCNRPEIPINHPLPRSNVVYIGLLPCRLYFPFW